MKIKNMIIYSLYFVAFISLGYAIYIGDCMAIIISVLTILAFLLVHFIIKSFKIEVPFLLILFIYIFLICAGILGENFCFYSVYNWWDDVLHFSFGFMCSYICFLFFRKFIKTNSSSVLLIALLFSFCSSISLGVIWEFFEFSIDKYLGFDMQKDTLVDSFNTTYFNSDNIVIKVDDISKTRIYKDKNDVYIKEGYLDIGLYDTVSDLFLATSGAFLCSMFLFYKKRKV